jgi:hypothetical protein
MGPAHKRHYAGRLGTNFQQITPFFSNALHPSVRIVCRHCRRLDVDPVAHLERERAGGRTTELAEGFIPSSTDGFA